MRTKWPASTTPIFQYRVVVADPVISGRDLIIRGADGVITETGPSGEILPPSAPAPDLNSESVPGPAAPETAEASSIPTEPAATSEQTQTQVDAEDHGPEDGHESTERQLQEQHDQPMSDAVQEDHTHTTAEQDDATPALTPPLPERDGADEDAA